MTRDEGDYCDVRTRLKKKLQEHENDIHDDTKTSVNYYIDHDEFEIALEGLCLDLMDSSKTTDRDIVECVDLGRILGLDKASVLNVDLWKLLISQKAGSRSKQNEHDDEK